MPALVDYPGVLKVRTHFTIGSDINVVTGLHFTYTGTPPSNATCATIASNIYGNAVTTLQNMMADGTNLVGVDVQDLTTPTSGFGEHLATTAGTRGTDVLPAGVAVLQNFPINRRYRGGKPRAYWPFGKASDLLNPSTWDTAFVAAAEAALGGYFVGIVASGSGGCTIVELVSISYYSGFTAVQNPITGRWRNVPKPRTVAIAPDPVLSVPVNPKPGSQRRRNLHSS